MNIQIFGKSKCFDTKKAERYFKERRIKYQMVDVVRYGMSKGEFTSVCRAVGLEALIDPKAKDPDHNKNNLPLESSPFHSQNLPSLRTLFPVVSIQQIKQDFHSF